MHVYPSGINMKQIMTKLDTFFEKETYKNELQKDKIEEEFSKNLEKAKSILANLKPDLVNLAEGKTLVVNIISDESITPLNNSYRGKNKPTDVLSWGFITQELMPEEAFGEIYISYETAAKQAGDKQHSLEYEVLFLFTHGLLHVFEYDHQTDEQEAEMDDLTEQIMK